MSLGRLLPVWRPPCHDTFASILRSGRGSGKKAAAGASLGPPRPPRPIFRPCIPPWGCPGGLVLVRGSLAAAGGGRSPRAAPARAGLRRATLLAAPARLAASAWPRACFTLRSAAFTSRSLAAAPPPRASSRKDCHRTALRRRRDQTNAARIAQRDPGTTKDKRVQPATAAAHTTHLT